MSDVWAINKLLKHVSFIFFFLLPPSQKISILYRRSYDKMTGLEIAYCHLKACVTVKRDLIMGKYGKLFNLMVYVILTMLSIQLRFIESLNVSCIAFQNKHEKID